MRDNIQKIRIAPESMLMFLGFLLIGYFIYETASFIISILVAVVLASFVSSIAGVFIRYKVPRVVSVVFVYIFVFLLFGGFVYFLLPIFFSELSGLIDMLPEGTFRDAVSYFGSGGFDEILNTINSSSNTAELLEGVRGTFKDISGGFVNTLSDAVGGIVNFILIIVISFYLSVSPGSIEQFLRAMTPAKHETRVISLWGRVEKKIEMWFRGQLLSALILAILTYVGMLILEVPYAFILSAMAGIFAMIPFGILIATIPALLIALSHGGVSLMLLVLVLYVILQQIEEYVLRPLILNRATGVPSLVILLSLVFGAKLIGFMGLILALPIAMVVIELLEDNEKKKLHILRKQASGETEEEDT
jgi:predicted PurR-regulated permease PerM